MAINSTAVTKLLYGTSSSGCDSMGSCILGIFLANPRKTPQIPQETYQHLLISIAVQCSCHLVITAVVTVLQTPCKTLKLWHDDGAKHSAFVRRFVPEFRSFAQKFRSIATEFRSFAPEIDTLDRHFSIFKLHGTYYVYMHRLLDMAG